MWKLIPRRSASLKHLRKLLAEEKTQELRALASKAMAQGDVDAERLRIFLKACHLLQDQDGEREVLSRLHAIDELEDKQLARLCQLEAERGDVEQAFQLAFSLIRNPDVGVRVVEGIIRQLERAGGPDKGLALRQVLHDARPDDVENRIRLARYLMDADRPEEAEAHLEYAVGHWSDAPKSKKLLMQLLTRVSREENVIAIARECRSESDDADDESYGYEIRSLLRLKKLADAVALAEKVAQQDTTSAYNARWAAQAFLRSRRNPELAFEMAQRACELDPLDSKQVLMCGKAALQARKFEDGERYIRQALANEANSDGFRYLVECLLELGRAEEAVETAEAWFDRIPAATDEEKAILLAIRGRAERFALRLDAAEASVSEALRLAPDNLDALFLLADTLEMKGENEHAYALLSGGFWEGSDQMAAQRLFYLNLARHRLDDAYKALGARIERVELDASVPNNRWDGEPVEGKSVMVIAEGGIGDEIRDLSALRDVAETSAHVIATCDPRLDGLLRRSFPDVTVHPVSRTERRLIAGLHDVLSRNVDEDVLKLAGDADVTLMGPDVFRAVRPTEASFAGRGGYLVADPELRQAHRAVLDALGPQPKVGFCWRSGGVNYRRNEFYTAIGDWAPVLALEAPVFVSLQHEAEATELETARDLAASPIFIPDFDLRDDMENLAAIVAELDLVIGPGTALMEMAGAVGTRSLLLSPRPIPYYSWRLADAETGQDRLYESVRHVCPPRPRAMSELMQRVVTAVGDEIAGRDAASGG